MKCAGIHAQGQRRHTTYSTGFLWTLHLKSTRRGNIRFIWSWSTILEWKNAWYMYLLFIMNQRGEKALNFPKNHWGNLYVCKDDSFLLPGSSGRFSLWTLETGGMWRWRCRSTCAKIRYLPRDHQLKINSENRASSVKGNPTDGLQAVKTIIYQSSHWHYADFSRVMSEWAPTFLTGPCSRTPSWPEKKIWILGGSWNTPCLNTWSMWFLWSQHGWLFFIYLSLSGKTRLVPSRLTIRGSFPRACLYRMSSEVAWCHCSSI